MRKLLALGILGSLAALVLAQVRGSDMLASFGKALNASKSVSATLTVQQVGGASSTYKVDLAKPNMARIDTPNQLIVSDGKTITTLDKGDNSYFKKPFSEAELKNLLANDELGILAPFFDANAYAKVASSKSAGTKVRKGVSYNVVEANMDAAGKKVVSFYLDPKDSIARMADITMTDGSNKDTFIIMAREFTIDGAAANFAFTAPAGSKELTLDEMNAGKWYTTWAEASAASKVSGKPIFLDFVTDWCHWCRVLENEVYSTTAFKNEAKNWILLRIDAEKGEGIDMAKNMQVTGYPTIKYVKADGTPFGGFVGYMPTEKVLASMQSAHK